MFEISLEISAVGVQDFKQKEHSCIAVVSLVPMLTPPDNFFPHPVACLALPISAITWQTLTHGPQAHRWHVETCKMAENSISPWLGANCKLITLYVCRFVCTCVYLYQGSITQPMGNNKDRCISLQFWKWRSIISLRDPQSHNPADNQAPFIFCYRAPPIFISLRVNNWKSYCANAVLRSKVKGVHCHCRVNGHGNKAICKPVEALSHVGV